MTPKDNNLLFIVGSGPSLCTIDLKSLFCKKTNISFSPHGFAQNPKNPNRIWAFEKWGASAAEVDILDGVVTQQLTCPSNTQFFGHGLFSPEGNTLFIVREDLETGLGHCIGFDTVHYKPILDYQVTPGGLHECHLLPDHTFLVASNGAPVIYNNGTFKKMPMVERSSLVHVDPVHGAVLDKKFIHDDDQVVGHFAISLEGSIVAISGPRQNTTQQRGAIYFGHLNKPSLEKVIWPDALNTTLFDEMLSVSMDNEAHVAVVTNPNSATLLFIDTRDGSFLGTLKNEARGVSFDENLGQFISNSKMLSLIDKDHTHAQALAIKTTAGDLYKDPLDSPHNLIVRVPVG
jgi:hypothetical protein